MVFEPGNPSGRQYGAGSEVPMEAVTGEGGKENEALKIPVHRYLQQVPVRLHGHQHYAECDEQIAEDKKIPDLPQKFQNANQGFINLILSDSA